MRRHCPGIAGATELNSWENHLLGANTPSPEMLGYIQETKPDLTGLSWAMDM
jgi:methanogenic corrinoid protein MtbC1